MPPDQARRGTQPRRATTEGDERNVREARLPVYDGQTLHMLLAAYVAASSFTGVPTSDCDRRRSGHPSFEAEY